MIFFNTTSIVSSIEFDRDDEYFAIAGVAKKKNKILEFDDSSGIEKGGDSYSDHVTKKITIIQKKLWIVSYLQYLIKEMMSKVKLG